MALHERRVCGLQDHSSSTPRLCLDVSLHCVLLLRWHQTSRSCHLCWQH